MPGAEEVLACVRQAGIKTALLTRNARASMQLILERFALCFDVARSREDGPIKPDPDGVLDACRQLGVDPERTCCVGDFLYDVVAANDAGATSVLLDPDQKRSFAGQADYVITDLSQLPEILGL